jgi:phosphatidate cytidylyltransferase
VLGAVALLSAWLGGWFLVLVWLAAAIAVVYEWITMTRVAPPGPVFGTAAFGLAAVLAAWIFAPPLVLIGVITGAAVLLLLVARTGRDRGWALAGLAYAVPIALVPVVLRFGEPWGIWPLLWMFAVVWATDIVAYFVGRTVGGPKLWPAVSPKKTWSGFVGGLAGGVLAGLGVAGAATTMPRIEVIDVVAMAALSGLASLASQAGDLAESAMKRHFGVKDSGTLIPGHGGFLDRLDGFAAVAILLCVLIPLAKVSLWTVAP